MSVTLLRLAAVLYAVGAGAYLAYLARPKLLAAASLGSLALMFGFLVQAVAIGLQQDHWGVRVIHDRLAAVPYWDVFERATATQRIYPTPYGEMLAQEERGRRLAS